jgi:hypothetical protein
MTSDLELLNEPFGSRFKGSTFKVKAHSNAEDKQ